MRNVRNLTICVLLLALVSTAAVADIHYVNPGDSIQAAIDAADPGDEIEVALGTYTEAIDFTGKAVRLYSSGGPDVTTIDGTGHYHVVQSVSGEGLGTVLEGFTITGGNANGTSPDDVGGGMLNNSSSPTVTNCVFVSNSAFYKGGGMYNKSSNPIVTNCIFSDNSATSWEFPYSKGGGMYNESSSPTVTDCDFTGNSAYQGGGMHTDWMSPTVTNCTFSGNSAYDGGGMNNNVSDTKVTNCTFIGNSGNQGGGMHNNNVFTPVVTNCTFIGNSATHGGGMWNNYSKAIVTNCIFWNDTPEEIYNNNNTSTAIFNYSDVQGGWPGVGNIDADPMFADADGRLWIGSPCIDAGNDAAVPPAVTTDLDGNPRIQDVCVDMGAFEAPTATPEIKLLRAMRTYIVEQVGLGTIDAEIEVSLLAKVDAAIAALDRGNPNDAKVAMNDLKALVNQVEAQTDKKITPETASEIIQRANAVIAVLGG